MQTPRGALGYWPGSESDYPYGSIYALHCLTLMANGRDVELPENNMQLLREYVRKLAWDWNESSESNHYQRAYAVYVLALGGDKSAVDMIARFDNVVLPTSARWLLAAALARNTGDMDRVRLYLNEAPARPWLVRELSGTLNSDIRAKAVELLALMQMKTDLDKAIPIANELMDFLQSNRYGNTQEYAFVIAALSDFFDASQINIDAAEAVILSGDSEIVVKGSETHRDKKEGPGAKFTVSNTGASKIFVDFVSKGIPAKPQTEAVSNGIVVLRRFFDSKGKPVDGNRFSHGETYIVELELHCQRPAENVVVADLLPAGFEIENPRLVQTAQEKLGLRPQTNPNHLEIRDERLVVVFNKLAKSQSDDRNQNYFFHYIVNAVTPGEFQHPAVTAECMYDPTIRGASKPGTIVVAPME
jgi:uncharacterized protein YfaS (alpha-2-macroglobulin family)